MEDWIVRMIESLGAAGIGLLMFLENLFPPLPSEFIMPLAGYLSTRDVVRFETAVGAGSLGSLLGAVVWYVVGRRVSEERFRAWVAARGVWFALRPGDVDRARWFFERYGHAAVFFGRLLPVVRTLISVPAGFTRMAFAPFLLYSALGTLLWTAALAYAGRLLGRAFPQIESSLGVISWIVLGSALVWYVVRVIRLRRAAG